MEAAVQNEFMARVARVQARGQNTNATVFVGMDHRFVYEPTKPASAKTEEATRKGSPLKTFLAFMLGMIAVLATLYIRNSLSPLNSVDINLDLEMAVNALASMGLGFLMVRVLRMRTVEQFAMMGLGILVMVTGYHNLVFWAPDLFTAVFSSQWVDITTTVAVPNSILFQGGYFAL